MVNPFVDQALMVYLNVRTWNKTLESEFFFQFPTLVNLSSTFKQKLYFDPTDFLNLQTDTHQEVIFLGI